MESTMLLPGSTLPPEPHTIVARVMEECLRLYLLPYAAYFLGIWIRNVWLPEPSSPPLKVLLMLGVPVALTIVTPILVAAQGSLVSLGYAYLLTVGIIIEQGMLVHETAISRLAEAGNRRPPPPAAPLTSVPPPAGTLAA